MKTFKLLYIVFFASVLVSCDSELLNPLPKDRLASDLFWKTEKDAISASNGIYSVLGGSWRYTMMDAYTDIGHVILQWRAESAIEKNAHDAASEIVTNEWRYYYNIIQASNTFLDNVDLIEAMNEDLRNRLKAEARTLRAFAYLNLVMLYGDVPLLTKNLTVEEAKSINRTATNAIWDFISEELTAASSVLPARQSDRGRVTKGTALGLKARAMLYAKNYQEAKTAAKSVMDLNEHAINESYRNLFDYPGQDASEVIFARQYAKSINANDIFNTLTANSLYAQRCQIVPTKHLVDAYLMQSTGLPIENPSSGFDRANPYKDRDPRLYHTVFTLGDILPNGRPLNSLPGSGTGDDLGNPAENVTKTGFYYKKYVSNDDYSIPNNCGLNLIYLRYAEVLLTYAEASVELGGLEINQSVLDAINELRTRPDVNMPEITTLNQSELREIVRRERLVELAMEGHRLFDIRRWRIAENVVPGTLKGMTYEDPANPGTFVTAELPGFVKEFNPDRHYLWPIPFREVTLNPNLTQNPGF